MDAIKEKVSYKILVVDDHSVVRQGLKSFINEHQGFEVVAESENEEQAFNALEEDHLDIVILDISLRGTSGFDILKKIKKSFPKIKVIILSMHEESIFAERALEAGAYGYVMKGEDNERIIEALETAIKGEVFVSGETTRSVLGTLVEGRIDKLHGIKVLTNRELEIFHLIGQGYSQDEIADKFKISIRTVRVHFENIKEKLSLQRVSNLVHFATKWLANA